jgi:peptidoglycan/LPS O-acetylase OafA/YrhL
MGAIPMAPASGAFDCLRLAAAFSVLFGHCYALTGEGEPLAQLSQGRLGFGDTAVYTFFAISGYLVTQSWHRDPSFNRFLARRVLRIVPALIFVIVASFAIVGPLTTTLGASDYFSQPAAWSYLTKIFIYPVQYALPGAFANNPFPNIVNGSLWTLRLEFGLYVMTAILGWLSILRCRLVNIGLALICLMMIVVLTQTELLNRIPFLHQTTVLFENALPFFAGAALAQRKFDLRLIRATIVLALLNVLLIFTPAFKSLFLLTLPLVVIVIARCSTCDLSRFGDYSYGLYLWAFPVQQSVVHFAPNITPIRLFLLAGTVAFVCAIVSWHLVEKHALALKPRAFRAKDTL